MHKVIFPIAVLALVSACTTSPLGRSQLAFFPEEQLQEMGQMAYANLKEEGSVASDPKVNRYVSCVAEHIVQALENGQRQWEVTVFAEDQANAFALPGGKIGVYAGLLDVAKNQAQLATVIAHEVAHVVADHSNERMSTNYAAQTGLSLANAALGGQSPQAQQAIMGVLGVGVQVGVLLPYSRTHEEEADLLGLDLMAKAGFDPAESVNLWRNMSQAGGPSPPEFLSTHPTSDTRIRALQQRLPHANELYREARRQGRAPQCSP